MNAYADYLMIISLPDDLVKEISRYKQASVNAIGHFEGMHNRACIVITQQVRCKPFFAQPALVCMGKRLSTMPPMELYFNGFGHCNASQTTKTIFAKIEQTEHTQDWFNLLTIQMGIKITDFVPQITVVRNIPVTAFNKLWPNFENREFRHRLMVNHLTILHRDTFAEHIQWQVYREFHFGNKLLAF
jgi:hypothetical protein